MLRQSILQLTIIIRKIILKEIHKRTTYINIAKVPDYLNAKMIFIKSQK